MLRLGEDDEAAGETLSFASTVVAVVVAIVENELVFAEDSEGSRTGGG